MDRRCFLGLAAVVGLSACTGPDGGPGPGPSAAPAPDDPDADIRARVVASELALIAAHRAALTGDPALARTLAPILAQHEEHLARVAPGVTPAPRASGSPAAAPTGTASPTGTAAPTGTASRAEVLADLAAAEGRARDLRVAACDAAEHPGLARDLCLIAASEAQHAAVLARARREAGA